LGWELRESLIEEGNPRVKCTCFDELERRSVLELEEFAEVGVSKLFEAGIDVDDNDVVHVRR
jgi:hypothetical protein